MTGLVPSATVALFMLHEVEVDRNSYCAQRGAELLWNAFSDEEAHRVECVSCCMRHDVFLETIELKDPLAVPVRFQRRPHQNYGQRGNKK